MTTKTKNKKAETVDQFYWYVINDEPFTVRKSQLNPIKKGYYVWNTNGIADDEWACLVSDEKNCHQTKDQISKEVLDCFDMGEEFHIYNERKEQVGSGSIETICNIKLEDE